VKRELSRLRIQLHSECDSPDPMADHPQEFRYRRLFEAARDGILILNAETGRIEDANQFMTELLGYARHDLVGKELWQIGLFTDIEKSR